MADPIGPWPQRLVEAPTESPVGGARDALLREGARLRELPAGRRDALWSEILARHGQARRRRWVLALGPALAAVVLVVAVAVRQGPERLRLGEAGELEVARGSRFQVAAGSVSPGVRLDQGRIVARIVHRPSAPPFTVTTPECTITDVGTVFTVSVAPGLTTVAVSEGQVRVARGRSQVLVAAGGVLRSDDPRLVPAPVAPPRPSLPEAFAGPLPEAAACANLGAAARATCTAQQAQGSGLDAENALVAQALEQHQRGDHAGAVKSLRAYQARFAQGLFAPEVSEQLVEELLQLDDPAGAAEAIAQSVERFGQSEHRSRMLLLRAQLLRDRLGQPAEALAVARGLTGAPDPLVREEALASVAESLTALDRPADADAAWRAYLQRFPAGAHAAEAQARLANAGP